MNNSEDAKELADMATKMVEAANKSEVEMEDVIKLEKADVDVAMNVALFGRA